MTKIEFGAKPKYLAACRTPATLVYEFDVDDSCPPVTGDVKSSVTALDVSEFVIDRYWLRLILPAPGGCTAVKYVNPAFMNMLLMR
jgi:hypothetical protein